MSFSSQIKEEILKSFEKDSFKEKIYIDAERFGESLVSATTKQSLEYEFKIYFDISNLNEKVIKNILKGVFLASGCIVDPNLDYHFETTLKSKSCAIYFSDLLSFLEFEPKIIKRKNINYVVYFKEADKISTFLSLVEANASMLKFEQIRVEKDVKNMINRKVNCETANLSKTINAAVKQLDAIEKLKKVGVYETLNEKLKYTAELREKYKEESLDYIAMQTSGDNKVTKSGLKHRLDKLIEMADEL